MMCAPVEVLMLPHALGFACPYAGGSIEIDFVAAAGSPRCRMAFVGRPLPHRVHLQLPALGGDRDVPFFRLNEQFLISTRTLSTIVDRALLEFESEGLTHRLILRLTSPTATG